MALLERRPPRQPPRSARSAGSADPSPLLVAGAAVAGLLAIAPLVYLAMRAAEPGLAGLVEILARPRTMELLGRSVALAGAVTAACMVLGVLAAWLVVRTDMVGRRFWAVALALPLAVPSYVAGFTWLSLWPNLSGFLGAFAVLTAVSFPYVLLPVAAALRGADPASEEVARSLGLGPLRVFVSVTLRRVWPAATAGGLLVALYVLSDFGAVSLMRYDTFTLGIFSSYQASFDRTPAAVLGCVLVLLAALLTWGESRARGKATARVGRGATRPAEPVKLGRWQLPAALGLVAVAMISLGIPAWSLTRWMAVGSSAGLDLGTLASAASATVQVAVLGALLTTVLAVPVGVLAARHRGRLSGVVETAAYAGHALPGVTIGLAMVFVGIRLLPGIYQQTPLLVIAYAVLFLPLGIGAVRTAVAAAPPQLEEMSRSLGIGRLGTLRRVTIPLAAPGVAAGAALVFLTCAKELPATLMLRPTGSDTLAVQLWSHTGAGQFAAAAPYAVALVLVAALPTLMLDRALRRKGEDVTAPALEITGLVAGYPGHRVLEQVDLTVPAGSLLAVLGESGCGKSTLLRVIAGFHRVEAGQVRLDGRTVAGDGVAVAPERRRVGLVPQEGALFGHLTVAGNVGFGLGRVARKSGRVSELLELVGLADHGRRMPAELSGGQQQRVALARALAPEPVLVLLDEPFNALDAGLRAELREQVRAVLRAAGTTSVLVTHDQEEALGTADQVAVLRGGRVAQTGTPRSVYAAPADLAVGTFVGEAVVLAATATGRWAETVLGELELGTPPAAGKGRVLLRPEQLRLSAPGNGGVPALVSEVIFHGHDTTVVLERDGQLVRSRVPGSGNVQVGDTVSVAVDGPVRFFDGG